MVHVMASIDVAARPRLRRRASVSLVPPFIAPALFDDADAALARVREIYDASVDHLRDALQSLRRRRGARRAACAPAIRSCASTPTPSRAPTRASATASSPARARYETTLTRPDLFAQLLPRAVPAAAREPRRRARGRHQRAADPGALLVRRARPHRGHPDAERRLLMRDLFDLPDLGAMDDGIANGTYVARAGEAHPLALFTAPRVDYSLHRLRHYTGTAPEHFQNFVLFTNYQFYIDEFVRLGHEAMAGRGQRRLRRLRRAGQRGRRGARARRRGRGDELGARAAAPAADAGLPPGARRRQRHHDGQHRRRPGQRQDHHRPHRRAAAARLDDARPLRRPAQHAAARRLRAGPRLRARGPRARRGPAAVGADPGAGRGPGGAREGGGRRHAAARATS